MDLLSDNQTPGMTLFPETSTEVYNPEYAQEKADRFSAVLGEANPGADVLTSDISSGYQEKWSQLLKAREDTQRLSRRNQILTDIAATRDPSRPVTLDELSIIESLSNDELYASDLSTILEKKYSDFYTNTLSSAEDNPVFQEAYDEDPDAALDVLDRAQFPMQRSLIAKDLLESTQRRADDTSWASWGVDLAKTIIPLYPSLKMRNRVEVSSASILPGNNLEDQISYLYSLPPEQFKATSKQVIDELADDNILLAQEFANALVTYSSSDQAWSNIMPVMDVAGTVPVGKVASLAKGMTSAGKAIVANPQNVGKMAAAAGMNKVAAISNVSRNIIAGDLSGMTTIKRIEEVSDRLPSLFAPQQFMTGGSKYLSAEAQARLEVAVQNSANQTLRVIIEGTGLDRLEPSQIQKATQEAYDSITDLFPSNAHKIIDQTVIPAEADKVTNTAIAEVRFGRQDGQPFKYEATAKNYAQKYIGLKTDDYSVEQNALGGWYIAVRKPIADVGDFRNLEIETTLATPNTPNNQFMRAIRSPDYLLPEGNVRARGQAVGHAELLTKVIDDLTKPYRTKSPSWKKEMEGMFLENQISKKYYKSAGEFEDAFYKKYKKPPTEDKYDAYYRYVQMGDMDYLVRDADKVKKLTAKGLENFDVRIIDKKTGDKIETITGRIVDSLPKDRKEPFRVRIIQNNKVTHNFPNMMARWDKNKDTIQKLLNDGYKIVQSAEGGVFTLVKDFKRNSIKMKTLGYIEGGHLEPKYDFFIRQGVIEDRDGAKVLTGDLNIGTVPTQKQAAEVAKVFDEARRMVKNSDPNARRFIDENLPISYAEFIKKVKTGAINLDVPIVATARGQRSSEVTKYAAIYGDNFHDLQTSDLNLLRETTPRYGQERSEELLDVFTEDKGSVVKMEWSSVLNPMDALASATRNMIDVRAMEDYALKSTNDWVQEFGHLMEVHPEVLKANSRYYMQNPVYKSGIDKDRAEAARLSMLSLYGQVDSLDSGRNVIKDKVLSSIFEMSGEKARDFFDSNWVTAKDAQSLIRKTAFDLKLGFWNIRQLWLQSSSIAATLAISPRSGWMGGRAIVPTRMALLSEDPQVIRGIYNKFGKVMGWQKDDFINMVQSMKQSGFANVGGDHTYLDQMSLRSPGREAFGRLRNSPVGKVASSHRVFFNEGELSARIVAYATAYYEFVKRNPGKIPDRYQQGAILSRAKTFTQNMTRESNSQWQKGWAGVATQFMSYHMRVAEQIWDGGFGSGRKLTQAEKLRFLGTMSLLYGGGTAVSATLPIFPTREMLRDWMAENGVESNDYPVADAVLDGLVSTSFESMFGARVDFSNFAPSGIPTFYDLLNEDKTWGEVVLGAGPGILMDLGSSVRNLAYAFGYSEGEVTPSDFLEVLRNVSTVDNWTKWWMAMNTGRYISRKGTYITDVNNSEAWLQALLGTAPEHVADSFAKSDALKKMQDARKKGLREYENYHRDFIRALEAGDEDSAVIYAKRRDAAGVVYDLTPSEKNRVNQRYFREKPVDEQIDLRVEEWNRKYKLFSNGEE